MARHQHQIQKSCSYTQRKAFLETLHRNKVPELTTSMWKLKPAIESSWDLRPSALVWVFEAIKEGLQNKMTKMMLRDAERTRAKNINRSWQKLCLRGIFKYAKA